MVTSIYILFLQIREDQSSSLLNSVKNIVYLHNILKT